MAGEVIEIAYEGAPARFAPDSRMPGALYGSGLTLDIKARAPGPAYAASLVNGELMGYIVTEEAARKNRYEALNRVFEPESGRRMVDAAVGLMNEMAGDA